MKQTLLALIAVLSFAAVNAHGQTSPDLTAGQLKKAQKLIAKIESLKAFAESNPTLKSYKARVGPLSSAVYKSVSNLPESEIKTDIATTVRYYELAARVWDEGETEADTRCANERPGFYDRLCQGASGRRQLFLAKARLHLTWAKAGMTSNGGGDFGLRQMVAEERRYDRQLAQRAVALLRTLEGNVAVHSSLADFETTNALAQVPYETFKENLRTTSEQVERILAWLPQNRLKSELTNALYSFQDGGVRWAGIYQPRVVKVSDLATSQVNAPSITAYQLTVPYTVAINWRQAKRYTDRADALAR